MYVYVKLDIFAKGVKTFEYITFKSDEHRSVLGMRRVPLLTLESDLEPIAL